MAVLLCLVLSLAFQIYSSRQQAYATRVLQHLGAHLTRHANGDLDIDLHGEDVTAMIQGLRYLRHVRNLNLGNTNISDADLKTVQDLQDLQYLDLDQTRISDIGADHLMHLHRLQHLNLNGTSVTMPKIQQLEQSIPGLIVEHRKYDNQ